MNFDKYIHSCIHYYHNQRHIHHPRKFLWDPLQPMPLHSSTYWTALSYINRLDLPFLFQINGIIQYVLLCLASFTPYVLIHVTVCINSLSLFIAEVYPNIFSNNRYVSYILWLPQDQTTYVEYFIIFRKTHS